MPPVYVFDVNETLLDLRALDAHFGRAFSDPGAGQGALVRHGQDRLQGRWRETWARWEPMPTNQP